MSQIVTATFDGEVLRPDQPLDFAPETRVRVIVEAIPFRSTTDWDAFERYMEEHPINSGGPPPKRDELYDRKLPGDERI